MRSLQDKDKEILYKEEAQSSCYLKDYHGTVSDRAFITKAFLETRVLIPPELASYHTRESVSLLRTTITSTDQAIVMSTATQTRTVVRNVQSNSRTSYQSPTKGMLSKVPAWTVPYLELSRIERTNGFYGFYMSHLIGLGWGACLAPSVVKVPQLARVAALIAIWVVWHRGAACTVNDILDREFDRQVTRCQNRPVARRAIPVRAAWLWYWIQVAVSSVLCLTIVPHGTKCLYHITAMQFLVSVYPLFKRWTDFPQLVLGVPLAWAVLMSCTALGVEPWTMQTRNQFAASLCLCASEVIRIVVLDYVNACQDTDDDVKAGVKSMAVRYRNTTKFILVMGSMQLAFLVGAGLLAEMSPVYFAVAVCGNIIFIVWESMTVDRKRPETCAWWFQNASRLIGGTTVVGLFSEYAFRTSGLLDVSS